MKKWLRIILVSVASSALGTSCSSLTDDLMQVTPMEIQGDTSQSANLDLRSNPASANGYFGRAHGDADGIPPDGQIRTNWGIYPSGGLDDEEQTDTVEDYETSSGK